MAKKKQSADQKAIEKLDVAWGKAASSGDLDAVVAFYARDGSVVWPDAPAAHGIVKIRAAWKQVFAAYDKLRLKFTAERITVAESGDLAVDFGKVRFEYDLPTGHVVNIGKYVVGWKKVDERWQVLYDCYNLNRAG